jgi:chaperonin GroEL
MAKQILKQGEARAALKAGIDTLAFTVTTTLGPKGRNVALDRRWGAPVVLHDGVSVAKEIFLKDPFENMGAQLVKQVSSQTNDKAGDGTTTATCLAQALVEEGLKLLDAGVNPMTLKKGMDKAKQVIVDEIKKIAKPLNTNEEIEQVATISSADSGIGKIIADAMEKVTRDGVITIDDGNKHFIEVEYKDGMEFEKGYITSAFVTDPVRMEADIELPFVFISDRRLVSGGDLRFVNNLIKETGRVDIVIIAESVEGDALKTLVHNKTNGNLKTVCIATPAIAERRRQLLEDLAILTGGTFFSKERNDKLEDITHDQLGQADRVIVGENYTRIIGGKGEQSEITKRVEQIRDEIKKAAGKDFEILKLKERLAKLAAGVAIIKVGAMTEVEMAEKKERVIDAVEATKAAVEEGIVPGGGIALLRIQEKLKALPQNITTIKDENLGVQLVLDVLSKPFKMILTNAGEDPEKVRNEIIKSDNMSFGYNVVTEEYGDLFKLGVVDPAKVTRLALENAVSVASMVLTTECLVTDIPEDVKQSDSALI